MIEENKIGADIFAELKAKKYCSFKKIINWLYFTENLLGFCANLMRYYQSVMIVEFYDNNFKLKLKSPRNNSFKNTIGFLFGIIEDSVKFQILKLEIKI